MPISHGHSALRIGRYSAPGSVYLITTCTWNRAPIFRDHKAARIACQIIHSPGTWLGSTCLAWVLMPDHWHGLVRVDDGDLAKAVAKMKSRVRRCLREQGRVSPVWQRAFHDRAIRRDDDLRAVARYIVANPLRAGLATAVGDYPYWNAVWL